MTFWACYLLFNSMSWEYSNLGSKDIYASLCVSPHNKDVCEDLSMHCTHYVHLKKYTKKKLVCKQREYIISHTSAINSAI